MTSIPRVAERASSVAAITRLCFAYLTMMSVNVPPNHWLTSKCNNMSNNYYSNNNNNNLSKAIDRPMMI